MLLLLLLPQACLYPLAVSPVLCRSDNADGREEEGTEAGAADQNCKLVTSLPSVVQGAVNTVSVFSGPLS